MDSDAIVKALAADLTPQHKRLSRQFRWAVAVSAAITALVFFNAYGLRDDFVAAFSLPRFVLKLGLVGTLVVSLWPMLFQAAAPVAMRARDFWPLGLAMLCWFVALAGEAILSPRAQWAVLAIGDNSLFCLSAIPLIGLPVLAATLAVLRRAAPANPVVSGALAGLFSGAVAALIYANHCPDDSPFFVALWYGLAMLGLTCAGAFAGQRLLRW